MNQDRRKALVEKIRLLFNRAECAVQDADDPESVDHEAQLALETARRLMLQYGIEESELEGSKVRQGSSLSGDAITVELSMRKPAPWVFSLAFVVADYFSCRVLYIPPAKYANGLLIFCGVTIASESSAYAFDSVLNQIRVLSRKYKVARLAWEKSYTMQLRFRTFEDYRTRAKTEYCMGIVVGLSKRLEELRKQEDAIPEGKATSIVLSYSTVADEIASRINPEHAEMPKKEQKWTGDSHLKAGLKDSEDVHITKGLTS